MRRRCIGLAAAALAVGLAGCTSARSAGSNGALACQHVTASLRLYHAATTTADPQVAARDRTAALGELRAALPLAAIAATSSGQWQALQTTLSESVRLPESQLVNALAAQCPGSGFTPSSGSGSTGSGSGSPPSSGSGSTG